MTAGPNFQAVRDHLAGLQDSICRGLEEIDGGHFEEQRFEGPGDSLQRPRVLSDGAVIEKAAVHFSSTAGKELPAAATERKPELAGREYRAASVSLIVHPRNPMAPTSHAKVAFGRRCGTRCILKSLPRSPKGPLCLPIRGCWRMLWTSMRSPDA